MTPELTTIRAALESLPAQCRYHGDDTGPRDRLYGREACCDTGIPAQRRKLAEQALRNLARPRAADTPQVTINVQSKQPEQSQVVVIGDPRMQA